jgi:hypothetical protein
VYAVEASSIAVHAAKLVAANKADDVIKVTDCHKYRSSSFKNNEFLLNSGYRSSEIGIVYVIIFLTMETVFQLFVAVLQFYQLPVINKQ